MFIAALFTITKTWKQPKCPSTDEWIKKMWHIYIYIWLLTALWDPMECSLPGSSVHGILQARLLEWVTILFSRGSSWLRNWMFGEGNGNPLQYSCLENPMDGGAWWATVHGVAKSQTWLSDFTSLLLYCKQILYPVSHQGNPICHYALV